MKGGRKRWKVGGMGGKEEEGERERRERMKVGGEEGRGGRELHVYNILQVLTFSGQYMYMYMYMTCTCTCICYNSIYKVIPPSDRLSSNCTIHNKHKSKYHM